MNGWNEGRGITSRWLAADATRGAAMVLVCVSHFASTWPRAGDGAPLLLLHRLGMLATPAFMVTSGLMLGLRAASRPGEAGALQRRSVDRGLFLLLVARPVITLAHVAKAGGVVAALRWGFVTDAIGLCALVGPSLLRCPPVPRAAAAVALGGVAWCLATAWVPEGAVGGMTKDLVVGDFVLNRMSYSFPLAPWLAVHVLASALGETLAGTLPGAAARRRLAWLGLTLTGAAVAARGAGSMALGIAPRLGPFAGGALWSTVQKCPPGPVYLAFHGGVALLLLAAVGEMERRGIAERPLRAAALLGRNSLFAFVAQYFVYYTGLVLLRPPAHGAWGAWLAASLAVVFAATICWDRLRGNRWLTVGIGPARPAAHSVPAG